ncbi:MAG: hypothetical protein ACO1QS_11865 [Verrucomicrobiota bacterium]
MKTTRQTLRFTLGFALIMACGLLTASVLDRTAFELVKEGNKYIVEQSRDKVIQIRSEKSSRKSMPTTWYVVYFDSVKAAGAGAFRFATGTELKFSAGNLVSIRRDVQLLEAPTDKYVGMDAAMLTVDSDRALEIALKEPVLESLKVMSTDMTLEQGPEGYPVWKISIWANKKDTTIDVKAGEIWVSCVDGKVCKITVNPGRVG